MKTVVITGSTRGLGLEMAKQFKSRNCHVVICGSNRNLEQALQELEHTGGRGGVLGVCCNVSDPAEVKALAEAAVQKFKKIDIWINNAGVNQSFKYAWEVEDREIDSLLAVDLKGAINGSNEAMRLMIRQGFGAIYNVEGMGSNDAFQPHFTIYGTAKRAVTYFTDALKAEIEECKLPIIVGKLSPGIMITDFLTSAGHDTHATTLDEKTKKVYNILGDYPDVIAEYLVDRILKNKKSGVRISWLTNRKAAMRFMTAGFTKRSLL